MALFGRNNETAPSPPPPVATPVPAATGASQSTLDAADRLMIRFGEVRGNGSDQDLADVLVAFADLSGMKFSNGWNSPWKPWIGFARSAHEQGNHALTFRIFMYAVDFNENIGPKLTGPFSVGLGYGPMNPTDYKALASVSLESLKVMQAERPDIDFAPEMAQAQRILAA